jgi:hypothetical protein
MWNCHKYFIGTPISPKNKKPPMEFWRHATAVMNNPFYDKFTNLLEIKELNEVEIDGCRYPVIQKDIAGQERYTNPLKNYFIQTIMFGVDMEFSLDGLLDIEVEIEATNYEV